MAEQDISGVLDRGDDILIELMRERGLYADPNASVDYIMALDREVNWRLHREFPLGPDIHCEIASVGRRVDQPHVLDFSFRLIRREELDAMDLTLDTEFAARPD
jgi:hypothetical protein